MARPVLCGVTMPGPVSRESSSAPLEGGVEVTVEELAIQPQSPGPKTVDSVETWKAQEHGFSGPEGEAFEEAPHYSPQELQLQAAAIASKADAVNGGISAVLEPLEAAIMASGRSGIQVADFAFLNAATSSPEFKNMLKTLSRAEVGQAVRIMVMATVPEASNDQTIAITSRLMAHVSTMVTTETGRRLQEVVVARLESAGQTFIEVASDPKQLERLTAHLTPAQRSILELPENASTADVKRALLERGALMKREANSMQSAGETTLYRSLLLHSQVGSAMLKENGIQPGSWAERGLAQVQARGEGDENAIKVAKLASSLSLIFVSAGVGLGVVASTAAGAGLEAGSLNATWQDIDRAKAGAGAGTAAANAMVIARRKATIDTVAAGVSVAVGAVSGSAGHAMAAQSVDDLTARLVGYEMLVEVGLDRGGAAAWSVFEPKEINASTEPLVTNRD